MIVNISAYQFVTVATPEEWRKLFYDFGKNLKLRGTIILSTEGINLNVAGNESAIEQFQQYLKNTFPVFSLSYKVSYSDFFPFKRWKVKVKPEIITFEASRNPQKVQTPRISPQKLREWLRENSDDLLLLDARNDYEIVHGTFKDAQHLNIKHFTEFSQALSKNKELLKNKEKKTVVTFCTGGIRCEKAGIVLQEMGFQEVYQLEGGILNYFAACQGEYYDGHCFVFDERIAVDSNNEVAANCGVGINYGAK